MKKKKEMKIVFTKQSHDGSGKPFFFLEQRLSDCSAWIQKMEMP